MDRLSERLNLRLTEAERARWEAAARQAKLSLSEWIRVTLNVVAGHYADVASNTAMENLLNKP